MKKLLLLSSSKIYGSGYLEYCKDEVKEFLKDTSEIVFATYAIQDGEKYVPDVEKAFSELGKKVIFLHRSKDPRKTISQANAIFIGGGNTFRLLQRLYKEDLIELIKKRVDTGMLYMGASAGSNVASPSISTTNDMPIVFPPSFKALSIFPYQINPHYIDARVNSKHMGETRAMRINEFHEENSTPVIGLREGSWISVIGEKIFLGGKTGAVIFEKNKPPLLIEKGLLPKLS